MKQQTEISFNQAIEVSINKRITDAVRFDYILDEVDTSSPEILDARDFAYYANELTNHDPDGKVWTSNEVRERMLKNNPELDRYALIDSFIDSEYDDIIDFF